MTTDTFPKGAGTAVKDGDTEIAIAGIAKGSGMIQPNMATMLAYVFTDAAIAQDILDTVLRTHVETTFNAITVDSDTSTSDTLMVFATGASGQVPITQMDDPRLPAVSKALHHVLEDLAHQIVRDGEGASKLIHVRVEGAANSIEADLVARTIANSPLVKTAIAGEDANWGRVVMAVGKTGVQYKNEALQIGFGGIPITKNGRRIENYDESAFTRHLQEKEVEVNVHLGEGDSSASVWTCDLTHGYISINADYRS